MQGNNDTGALRSFPDLIPILNSAASSKEQLKTAYAELAGVMDRVSDSIISLDNQLQILYINKAARSIFPQWQQMLGQALPDIIPVSEELTARLRKIMLTGQVERFEYDSSIRRTSYLVSAYPHSHGIVTYVQDIGHLRKAEAEAAANRELFSKAFQASPLATAIYDEENGHVEVNDTFSSITGWPKKEVIGKSPVELGLLGAGEFQRMRKSLKQNGVIRNQEVKLTTKNGSEKLTIFSIDTISTGDKELLLVLFQDITDKKLFENEMSKLDRMSVVAQMAATISHEVRNPMTTVRGFLQLLSAKPEAAHFKSQFALMIEELDRANVIISEYLSLAKNLNPDGMPQVWNINDVLVKMEPLLKADAANSGCEVQYRLGKIPDILLYEKEFCQMLLNLAKNAFEAMPGGSLEIATYREQRAVVLSVKDNGPGMSSEVLSKIGTPFVTTKEKGTGLGLSVCYSIVKKHEGSINVFSGSEGTQFLIRFPIGQE